MLTALELIQQFKGLLLDLIKGEGSAALVTVSDFLATDKEVIEELFNDRVSGEITNEYFVSKIKQMPDLLLSQGLSLTQMVEADFEAGVNNIITTITGQITTGTTNP